MHAALILLAAAALAAPAAAFSPTPVFRGVRGRSGAGRTAAPSRELVKVQGEIFGLDSNIVIGVGIGLAGVGGGIFALSFIDSRLARDEQRGGAATSEETKTKLAAGMLEDVELKVGEAGLDDTVASMERALAKAQGREEDLGPSADYVPEEDDGW